VMLGREWARQGVGCADGGANGPRQVGLGGKGDGGSDGGLGRATQGFAKDRFRVSFG